MIKKHRKKFKNQATILAQIEAKYINPINGWTIFRLLNNFKYIVINNLDSPEVIINLPAFVQNPFTKKATINFNLLRKVVGKAQRLADDLVDLQIKSNPKVVKFRKTKLGHTGFADMLAAINIQYGTAASTFMGGYIQKTFTAAAYSESFTLAKERGCFPEFHTIKDTKDKFLKRLLSPHLDLSDKTQDIAPLSSDDINNYAHFGRRNDKVLSIHLESHNTNTTQGIDFIDSDVIDNVGFLQWASKYLHSNFKNIKETLDNFSKAYLKQLYELSPYFPSLDLSEIEKTQKAVKKWVDCLDK